MPRSSSLIDWAILKPEILRLLSAGRTRKEVIEEVSREGPNITMSQLEYQLKCWGQRTNLTELGWRYASYKVQKRAINKKKSAIYFNGALIPKAKVIKETRRHDRPTLLPVPGGSPKCPEGFDLVICTPVASMDSPPLYGFSEVQRALPDYGTAISSLPWMRFFLGIQKDLTLSSTSLKISILNVPSFTVPAVSQFPGTFIELCGMKKTLFDVERLDRPYMALLGSSDSEMEVPREAVPRRRVLCESQVAILIGLHIFQVSNKMSTDGSPADRKQLYELGRILKLLARDGLSWEGLLKAGSGATSSSMIEQLFDYSITSPDMALAELMLRVGANPNQQVYDKHHDICVSALEFSIAHANKDIAKLLIKSNAACGQTGLEHATATGDFSTTDRMLESDSSLDLNFNYLDGLDQLTTSRLGVLELETVTLIGLVCLNGGDLPSLKYLLAKGAAIDLDTMILASFATDSATIRFLMQQGGSVVGVNRLGFSCLDGAVSRKELDRAVVSLLLCSGANVNIAPTHCAYGFQASPLHRLLLHPIPRYRLVLHPTRRYTYCELDSTVCDMFTKLLEVGGDMDYRIRHVGLPSELDEAYQKLLWSQPSEDATVENLIAQSKAQSILEYAIISGHRDIASSLVHRGCRLRSREIMLAVRYGGVSLVSELRGHWQGFGKEEIREICLRLALRWGHDKIVRLLIQDGARYGERDIIDALQYPGELVLSREVQLELIRATPGLHRQTLFGIPLLELCALKFDGDAFADVFWRFPAAYDSGALAAIVLRSLQNGFSRNLRPSFMDIETMASRRTEQHCDWVKENTAILFATMYRRADVLDLLATPGTACVMQKAQIPKKEFVLFLDSQCDELYFNVDPTHGIGCQDWVPCSPLLGLVVGIWNCNDFQDCLQHLLSCSYEPDALTVVMAAAQGKLTLLRSLRSLDTWKSVFTIDDHNRLPWCPTALQAATSNEFEEVVEFLLDAGTSVNEMPPEEPIGYLAPRTALQAAVDKGSLKLVNRFIELGACVNAPAAEDSGATALQLACIHGYLTISLRLLELGADVNARGAEKNGRTALEGAAEHGRIDTIQLLLNHGVHTEGPYMEQYLQAVFYAENNRHFAAATLLRNHRGWTAADDEWYRNLQSA